MSQSSLWELHSMEEPFSLIQTLVSNLRVLSLWVRRTRSETKEYGARPCHLLVTQEVKSGSLRHDLLNLKGQLQDPKDRFHSKQIGQLSQMSAWCVHMQCIESDGISEEDTKNQSSLLLIPSSPTWPFLQVGIVQGGATSVRPTE